VSEVTDLIDRYRAGEMTLDELARRFRDRRWPRTLAPPRPSSYLEMAALAQEDPGSVTPGSFDDVEVAFVRHELSADEYRVLRAAMSESIRAEEESAGNP
jgi:hypothetical protein